MKPIPYDKFSYLWPPRPENAIPPELLNFYEAKGWCAQYKKNGTCGLIFISPEKDVTSMNRHKEDHRTWDLNTYLKMELIKRFPEPKWYVLVCEILHLKTPTIKDTIYVFDVLVWQGVFLFDSTFLERAALLDERLITKKVKEENSHYILDPEGNGKIWYAKRFFGNLFNMWMAISDIKIDEGLVLKNPDGKLGGCMRAKDNSNWQVKCRKAHKNYSF